MPNECRSLHHRHTDQILSKLITAQPTFVWFWTYYQKKESTYYIRCYYKTPTKHVEDQQMYFAHFVEISWVLSTTCLKCLLCRDLSKILTVSVSTDTHTWRIEGRTSCAQINRELDSIRGTDSEPPVLADYCWTMMNGGDDDDDGHKLRQLQSLCKACPIA